MSKKEEKSDHEATKGRMNGAQAVNQRTKARYISKAQLRAAIHEHLIRYGFFRNGDEYYIDKELSKQRIRDLHMPNLKDKLWRDYSFIEKQGHKYVEHFAYGYQVDPEAIEPELIEVAAGTPESDLFRLATYLWSVPVSQGFGRRMRFLVKDRQNGKLIGIFGLGDPVFNLSARDKWIGWSSEDRKQRLVHVMDAFVVGAVPPYSQIIGGKLVAALMGSTEVQQVYERKYLRRTSIISGAVKCARLALLMTTSALGRSSIYNRLVIPHGPHFIRIGVTKGFGHFHLSGEIFELMRQYLKQINHRYASGHRFGMGPNWRLRVIRVALEEAGLNGDAVQKHGIQREVYAIPLAKNWQDILLGRQKRIRSCVLSVKEITEFCLDRWLVPRARRDNCFKQFEPNSIISCLLDGRPWNAA